MCAFVLINLAVLTIYFSGTHRQLATLFKQTLILNLIPFQQINLLGTLEIGVFTLKTTTLKLLVRKLKQSKKILLKRKKLMLLKEQRIALMTLKMN